MKVSSALSVYNWFHNGINQVKNKQSTGKEQFSKKLSKLKEIILNFLLNHNDLNTKVWRNAELNLTSDLKITSLYDSSISFFFFLFFIRTNWFENERKSINFRQSRWSKRCLKSNTKCICSNWLVLLRHYQNFIFM